MHSTSDTACTGLSGSRSAAGSPNPSRGPSFRKYTPSCTREPPFSMNETQIIQQQLATERLHFAEVANTFASTLDHATLAGVSEFTHACAQYFDFAVKRLAPGSKSGATLARARAASAEARAESARWREFIQEFNTEVGEHFA